MRNRLTKVGCAQGPDGDNVPQALTNYGVIEGACGKLAEAVPLLKKQWEMLHLKRGEDNFLTLQALNYYSKALWQTGHLTEAMPLTQSVVEKAHRILGDEHGVTQDAIGTYATMLMEQDRTAEAEPLLRRANAALLETRPDHPIREYFMLTFAQCLIANDKWAEAEIVSRENWEWHQSHPNPTGPAIPESLKLLNQCLQHNGKPPELKTPPASEPATRPAG